MSRENETAQAKADETIRNILQTQPNLLHTLHASAESAEKVSTFISTLRTKLTAMYLQRD